MATALTKDRKTPGVYVTEFSAFPPSVVGVATAIPIFIGYTETAQNPSSGQQMYLQPVAISSMADFYSYFGYGYSTQGIVEEVALVDDKPPAIYDFQASSSDGTAVALKYYLVGTSESSPDKVRYTAQFNLFSAMELFYGNGGGDCYVISVANYWGNQSVVPTPSEKAKDVSKDDLLAGLAVARDTRGGTMLVVPDACLLVEAKNETVTTDGVTTTTTTYDYSGYQPVAVEMVNQSGEMQDRVAILDMPGALVPDNWSYKGMQAQASAFYTLISPAAGFFSYGTCYGPAVESSLLDKNDVLYSNLSGDSPGHESIKQMNNLLTTQASILYPSSVVGDKTTLSAQFVDVAAHIAAAYPVAAGDVTVIVTDPTDVIGVTNGDTKLLVSLANTGIYELKTGGEKALDQYLLNAAPLLGNIQQILAAKLNVVPPSGIMAGIWAKNDAQRGVWNAPANFALNEITAPMVKLTDEQQGEFNVPLNGNAIDVLRSMINRGTVVWGARTLDGNSLDYRYIQVRRTLIYIEQSIKNTLQQFVFAANDGVTWATVTASISNFLTQLWQAGGLMGDKASDAFTVKCGVPTTMSGLDVLNGYMIVNVTVQMIHPAEFIELTFTQTMQGV